MSVLESGKQRGYVDPGSVASGNPRASFWAFGLLAVLVLFAALFGGSARADVRWLVILRPIAIIVLAIALFWKIPDLPARKLRVPALFLAAFGVVMLLQLVPLPPAVWTALSGRAIFADAANLMGAEQPWRPLSITPWLTANAMVALAVPAAGLACLSRVRADHARWIIPSYLGLIAVAALIGVLQAAGAIRGLLVPYAHFHPNSALGFFANRNHSAVFLATAYPVLRLWVETAESQPIRQRRQFAALAAGIFLIPLILVTGSRSGMVVAAVAIAASLAMKPLFPSGYLSAGKKKIAMAVALGVPLAIAALLVVFGKAVSIERLTGDDLMAERRVTLLPVNLDIALSYLPFGAGHGSFDTVFRMAEPDWSLSRRYFNHAHNDLVELMIESGVLGLALLIALVAWMVMRLRRAGGIRNANGIHVRAGVILAGLWFLASLTDYPLRTPLASLSFILALFWIAPSQGKPSPSKSAVSQ